MAQTRTVYKQGRHYVWPEKPPHELEVTSVTTIIGGGIPKPALAPWNAKMVATFAVENKSKWMELDDADAIDLLKRSPFRQTRKRADEGTLVHAALEAYATGGEEVVIPPEQIGLKGQYAGALQFLRELDVEILHAEATVFSREHKYAGTSDIFGLVSLPPPLPQGRKTAIIDYKTGKAVYPEYAVQLSAYAFGDFIGMADGTEAPVPDVDYLIVVRPKRRGGFEAVVYEADREIFEVFLAAKVVHGRERMIQGKEVGRELVGPDDRE